MIVYKQVNQGLIFVECYIYDPIFSKYRCIASEVVTVMAVSGPISPFVASIFDKVYVKNTRKISRDFPGFFGVSLDFPYFPDISEPPQDIAGP